MVWHGISGLASNGNCILGCNAEAANAAQGGFPKVQKT